MNMHIVLVDQQSLPLNNAWGSLARLYFQTMNEQLSIGVANVEKVSSRKHEVWTPNALGAIAHGKRKAGVMEHMDILLAQQTSDDQLILGFIVEAFVQHPRLRVVRCPYGYRATIDV